MKIKLKKYIKSKVNKLSHISRKLVLDKDIVHYLFGKNKDLKTLLEIFS